MKRREFITLLGVAAAWPLAARAQRTGTIARLGYLSTANPAQRPSFVPLSRDYATWANKGNHNWNTQHDQIWRRGWPGHNEPRSDGRSSGPNTDVSVTKRGVNVV
jgi:hypothetical protein